MPAYNEARGIAASILDVRRQFESVSPDFEIIVVNDGSTDETGLVVQGLTSDRVKAAGYRRNLGKGHAIRIGLLMATGEYCFLLDSDSEIRALELRAYVEALRYADIVIGSKRHPLSVVRTPIMRRFLSLGFNILERILTGVKASDTQSGLKAAKSSALYKLLPLLSVKKYAFDAELLAVASLLGLKIRELPVYIDLRATFSARKVFRMFVDLLGIAYRLRIKRWYQKNMVTMSDTYRPIIPW